MYYIWIAEVYLRITHDSSIPWHHFPSCRKATARFRRTPLTGAGSTASLGGNWFDLGLSSGGKAKVMTSVVTK